MSGDHVTGPNDAIRRSLQAIRPAAENDDHPGHDVLEAYVEGRLSEEERASIDRLAAQSAVVAEDLADLQAIHQTLAVPPMAQRDIRWRPLAVAAAVAASLVIGLWLMPTRLQAPTRVTSRLTSDEDARVKAVIAAGTITLTPQVMTLMPREGTLLGAEVKPPRFRLLSPLGTSVIEARPQFTWNDGGAESYTVMVFDQNFSEVTRATVSGTSWRPDRDLPRGSTYVWQVTAHVGNLNDTEPKPPRPEARFHVADEATAQRVADARRRLDANDPLPLAIVLADNGLIADARAELARAALVPATADIARQLLASLDQGTPITTKPAQ